MKSFFKKIKDKFITNIEMSQYSSNSIISVNGKTYSGNSCELINDELYIDGKLVDNIDDKEITINITGDVETLKTTSGKVTVNGDVKNNVRTMSGDVKIKGNVSGNINTMSGDVRCKDIGGNVSTMSGDISK